MQRIENNHQLFAVGDWPILFARGIEKGLREARAEWMGSDDLERSIRRWQRLVLEFLFEPREFRFFNPQPEQSLSLQGFVINPSKRVYPLDIGEIALSALVIPGFDLQKTEGEVMSGLRLHPVRRGLGIRAKVMTEESRRLVLGGIRKDFDKLIPCSSDGWLGDKEPTRGLLSRRLSITAEYLNASGTGAIIRTKEFSRVTVAKPFAKEPLKFEMATDTTHFSGTIPRHSPLNTLEARDSLNLLTGNVIRAAIGQMEKAVK